MPHRRAGALPRRAKTAMADTSSVCNESTLAQWMAYAPPPLAPVAVTWLSHAIGRYLDQPIPASIETACGSHLEFAGVAPPNRPTRLRPGERVIAPGLIYAPGA